MASERSVIARQMIAAKQKAGKRAPALVDLETALDDISIADTIEGSSTLTLSFSDPGWDLLDSGFFDVNDNGKLDPIDLNYPDGSELWWSVTQVGAAASQRITMTFMERGAVDLMGHRGPLKADRAKTTRAEFIQSLVLAEKDHPLTFHCEGLRNVQPVDGHVLHIGDSLGYGVSKFLVKDLGDDWLVATRVKEGISTATGLGYIQNITVPAVVVVQLGSNDNDPAAFETAARAILSINDTSVFLWSTIHRATYGAAINAKLDSLKAEFAGRLHLADWDAAVNSGKITLSDGLHTDVAGYKFWAARLAARVNSLKASS